MQKKWDFIVNVAYFGIILGLAYFLFDKCMSLLLPLLISLFVAMVLNKPIRFLEKKTHLKRGPISVVLVLLLLALGVGLIVLIGFNIVMELRGFFSFVYDRLNNLPQLIMTIKNWILGLLANLPQSFSENLSATVGSFLDNLAENGLSGLNVKMDSFNWSTVISAGGDILMNTVGQFPTLIISFVITVISTIFVCSDYNRIRDFILLQVSPETGRKIYKAKQLCVSNMLKMIKAYGLIFIITTVELSIAFSILRLLKLYTSEYLFIIAILIAIVDIIPVLGTGTVLIPWGVFSLLTGRIGLGIGLLVTYAIILVIRQILEPKLVSGQVGLPPIVTITSMYIGTKVLGVFGFFLLPFFITIINEMNKAGIIHLFKYNRENTQSSEEVKKDEEGNSEELTTVAVEKQGAEE